MFTADTNVFVYAVDARDPFKQQTAMAIRDRLEAVSAPIGLQVVSEFYAALTRRLKRSPWEAAQGARNLMASYPTFAANRECVSRALAEASAGRFSYWDALFLTAADLAGCTIVLSEDMADGARLGAVEVIHPFAPQGISERARIALSMRD